MYEPQRLTGHVPLATAVPRTATVGGGPVDIDPVGLWQAFASTFRRRWRLFAAIAAGVVAIVAIVTLLTPRSYTTDTKVLAGNPNAVAQNQQGQTGLSVLNALLIGNTAQSAETYVDLFSQTPVVQRVIDRLHLKTDVATLKGALRIKPVTNTNILSLSVTWSDPVTSAAIANTFASVFVERQNELVSGQANGAVDFLSKQLPEAKRKLLRAETALADFQTSHHIADLSAETTSTVNAAAAIDARQNQAQLDKKQADEQVAVLGAQLAVMKPTTGGGQSQSQNPVLAGLNAQFAQAQVALDNAEQQYTESHPTVIALKQQIADLKRRIAREKPMITSTTSTVANPVYQQLSQQLVNARANSAGATAQLAALAAQRRDIDPKLRSLPAAASRLADLRRQQKTAEDVYNALSQKYNDAMVARTSGMSDLTVTQPAVAELATKTPHAGTNLAVGLIMGLLLGLGVIFLVDWFDGRIRDERDVEGDLQLPVLASVPLLPSGDGAAAIPATIRNAALESYFQLVLAMRYSSDRPLRSVTITSPLKGDGKSTIAMNVAGAFGEIAVSSIEHEARVLVVDADMRRPSLHRKFEVPNELGLSDILIGRATLAQCVQRTDRPGVDVLTSGQHSPNPIKLLQSSRFDSLMREARERYATVIVDAPALVPVFDAAIVAAKTDGTVMILSAGHTDRRSTQRALARLESVGVNDLLGTVVNRTTHKVEDYSDYFASAAPARKELPGT